MLNESFNITSLRGTKQSAALTVKTCLIANQTASFPAMTGSLKNNRRPKSTKTTILKELSNLTVLMFFSQIILQNIQINALRTRANLGLPVINYSIF